MTTAVNERQGYFAGLAEHFGAGWNRFWFMPSDPFTLSLLRVLLGAMAIVMAATYTPDLDRLLGPEGFLPLETVTSLISQRDEQLGLGRVWRFSYFDYVGSSQELWLAHGVSLAVLIAFTLGAFSRVTSVLALGVVLSYLHRSSLVTSQFEPVLVFPMFYLCFGPSGAYLSIDAWMRRRKSNIELVVAPDSMTTIAIRFIQVHLALVYMMSVLAKMFGDVWWNGTAMWWLTLNSPERLLDFRFLGSSQVGNFVINAWSHAQVLFELAFPVLIWNRWARPLLLVIGVVLWTLMGLVTGLVSFSAMMVVASVAFIEPEQAKRLYAAVMSRHPATRTSS
jgi:hypothetical protein